MTFLDWTHYMENEKIKEIFDTFLKSYPEEQKSSLWTIQSTNFRKFWNERIIIPDSQELTEQEIDEIVRILDSHGKGNTKDSEAIAGVMIPQGAWREMFRKLQIENTLTGCINLILKTSSSEERIRQIDKLYGLNNNRIKYLTGKSGNAICCLLAAFDPFNNLSIVSLNDRIKLLKSLGIEYDPISKSIGLQIDETDHLIKSKFKEAGIHNNTRTISSFAYHSAFRDLWKPNEPRIERELKESDPNYSFNIRYWIYAPGRNAQYWSQFYNEGIMALGWNQIGNFQNFDSRKSLTKKLQESIDPNRTFSNDSLACWQFYKILKPGDIIIPKKGKKLYLGFGVVESDYYYDPSRRDYHHLRKVKWMSKGEWIEDSGPIVLKTLTDITKYPEYVNKLKVLLSISESIENGVKEPTSILPEIPESGKQYWWINANPSYWNIDNFKEGQEQSYTTYNESGNKRRVYEYFKMIKPGDLIIGYQSTPSLKVKALFEVTRGIYLDDEGKESIAFIIKEFFTYPATWEELKNNPELRGCEVLINNQGSLFKLTQNEYEIITETCRMDAEERLIPYSLADALSEIFISEENLKGASYLLEYKKNIILQGPPGTGKTFIARRLAYLAMGVKDSSKIEMIQFHQSYSYEDFIQGYRPTDDGRFYLQNGIFFEFCRKAKSDPMHKYFFIIDEINRGNLSKIFGELMMLIEQDKRGKEFAMKLTYSYSDRESFYIPENIYIIGTMNTADRSLAIVDYALRRRFVFIDIKPAFNQPGFEELLKSNRVSSSLISKIKNRMEDLNNVIAGDDNLRKWFSVGHSYFCSPIQNPNEEWYKHIIINEIGPLLREYWFDDEEKAEENIKKLLRD